jgi:hypothetical protein
LEHTRGQVALPPRAGNDAPFGVDQDRKCIAELPDAGCDLFDLPFCRAERVTFVERRQESEKTICGHSVCAKPTLGSHIARPLLL